MYTPVGLKEVQRVLSITVRRVSEWFTLQMFKKMVLLNSTSVCSEIRTTIVNETNTHR